MGPVKKMAYFIFGYFSMKLGPSVDGHEKITRCTANEHVHKVCPRCGCEFKGGLSLILDDEQYI
jgi:hypothetical protein